MKLPRRGWGEQRLFPGRNGDRNRARGDFLRSQTVGGDLSAGSRREEKRREAPAAEQGGRHKGGGLAAAASAHAGGGTARGPARPKSRTGGYE